MIVGAGGDDSGGPDRGCIYLVFFATPQSLCDAENIQFARKFDGWGFAERGEFLEVRFLLLLISHRIDTQISWPAVRSGIRTL